MGRNRKGIHEERDRKCNIYASHNPLQQEPRHDDYDEESNPAEFEKNHPEWSDQHIKESYLVDDDETYENPNTC